MLANRRFLAAAAVLAALSGWLCFVPLFGLLGYEFSLALSVAGSFAAAWLSTRARTFTQAITQGEALLTVPLVLISANALRVRNCDYWTGLAFFALLPVVSVACATATGFVCARLLRRPALGACLVILASIAWGLVRFYRTPAIFGFDPFVGYFAGTLYDEDL